MENNRINSKFQKKVGGNWGGPKGDQKRLRIDQVASDRPEVEKPKGSKKYKEKKPRTPFYACPFCEKELLEVISKEAIKKLQSAVYERWSSVRFFWGARSKKCHNCPSRELHNACPCCKRDTWYNKETKRYKHQHNWGCGFTGESRHGRM